MGQSILKKETIKLKTVSKFINRDLSWLEFNKRVLAQSLNAKNPLLERVFFLAIYSSNLDEFFMKEWMN